MVAQSGQVLVTEWVEGVSLATVIASGTTQERDEFGTKYLRFLFSGPARAGLLHADPHPGNYRVLGDGRLGVLDFGAVARVPDGLPPVDRPAASVARSTATSTRWPTACARRASSSSR